MAEEEKQLEFGDTPTLQTPSRAQLEYPLDAQSQGALKLSLEKILPEMGRNNALTIPTGSTTFDVRSSLMTITGSGASTIATITGGYNGQHLTLVFTDANITITDDSSDALNTVNLASAFTSASGTVLHLVRATSSWKEVGRTVSSPGFAREITVATASGQNSITITGLDLQAATMYQVMLYAYNGNSTDDIKLTFNNDTGSNYAYNGVFVSQNASNLRLAGNNTHSRHGIILNIYQVSGERPIVIASHGHHNGSKGVEAASMVPFYGMYDSTTNVTEMKFAAVGATTYDWKVFIIKPVP